ncbi:MAG: glycoside hydrolase, partial [Dehalococcoidia bacterium]
VYARLVETAESLGAPVALDATNELLVQLAWYVPETFQDLSAAYKKGIVYPIYTHAHHTHNALLTPDEIADELRLNAELLHRVMGIPEPRRRGAFPTEESLDASKLAAYKDSGMDYVLFPHLNASKAHFRVEGEGDVRYEPFLVGPDLLALPRHFPVSQHIWRPITRFCPDKLTRQGYVLGEYPVFAEEYRDGSTVSFPIGWDEAVAEYTATLEKALAELPDGGLILYLQDLELMDFGDTALRLMEQSWKDVIGKKTADVRFITPDDYLDDLEGKGEGITKTKVRFYQVSWTPEIRLVLRYDGHYPPLDAGEFRGVDLTTSVFKQLPFVFWEPGRFLVSIFGAILDAFGMPRQLAIDGATLYETRYAVPRFDFRDQLALYYRFMKRADNWGWRPEEGRQKRPFLYGYHITELLLHTSSEDCAFAATRYVHPGDSIYRGAERILEFLIDARSDYLRNGIEEGGLAGDRSEAALLELERSRSHRVIATEFAGRALGFSGSMGTSPSPDGKRDALVRLLRELRGYCREVFLATDHIQRAWGNIGDTDAMVLTMYRHLQQTYPPMFPAMFRELFPEEWAAREDPKLS